MASVASEIDALLEQAARLAAEHLEASADRSRPVVDWRDPADLERELALELPDRGRPLEEVIADARRFLARSVRTGHPFFFNQLFNRIEPAAILGEWLAAVANTSMYTYEAAPVFTLIEEKLSERLCALVGFEHGEGVLGPGGSTSNLMAMLAARTRTWPRSRIAGLPAGERPAVLASAEAHYSIPRAASILGLGLEAVIPVPCDDRGAMRPEELARALASAAAAGRKPFFVCATAGTTMAGAYDPVAAIAPLCREHGAWLHVDAAYGGSALFSPRHRHLLAGIDQADSVAWNPHKAMAVPLHCSALLMRRRGDLEETFATSADYLFHDTEEAGRDRGDMTLQCGRRVDALKLWLAWQAIGDDGFRARVDHAFALVAAARERVSARPDFELVREPMGCNLLFRWLPAADAPPEAVDALNVALRERLKRSGRIMLNYSRLDGRVALRLVLTHPELRPADLDEVLDAVAEAGRAAELAQA